MEKNYVIQSLEKALSDIEAGDSPTVFGVMVAILVSKDVLSVNEAKEIQSYLNKRT